MLVESDTNDVRRTAQLVWAATKWIASCRGWKVEEGDEKWDATLGVERDDEEGSLKDAGEVWTVRRLERNTATFLRGVADP